MTQRSLRAAALFLACLIALASSAAQSVQERVRTHVANMSFLDNGRIRLGVDLNLGGAITYLSRSGADENLVNSYDFGRQIQMSYYSGPVPFTVPGKEMKKEWNFIGWNPIQVGDAFGNASRILESSNDGKTIYVKSVPMHWPLDNVPGECTFECWLNLDDAVVHARCRLVNNRPDHQQFTARTQELPAVYTNGPWYRLITYNGAEPFTGGAVSRIEKPKDSKAPWAHWTATESWAALVDDHDFGLGIWSPGVVDYSGGFAGKPGKGGPTDGPTGYIAPNSREILDWNIVHEYQYDLIVGKTEEIRKYVYAHGAVPALPKWEFRDSRLGWHYTAAIDAGLPIRNQLDVRMTEPHPELVSPVIFLQAAAGATVVIDAALQSESPQGRLYWRRLGTNFSAENSIPLVLPADGTPHVTTIHLAGKPGWSGAIIQLRIDPVTKGSDNAWIRLKSVRIEP